MKRFLACAFVLVLFASISQTVNAAPMKEILCPDDIVLNSHEMESETFECCDQKARFIAAASVTKALHYYVQEKCAANGYELSAIARVCVNFKEVSDGKCVAIGTIYFSCGCCVIDNPVVDDCKYDEKHCDNGAEIETSGTSQRYMCCDVDDRWNATYDTMKLLYTEADEKCSVLDCKGGLGIRGYQIDYVPVSPDDNACVVKTTLTFSCCCVCR